MFGTDGGSPHMIFDDIANDSGWILGADDANLSWFCIKGFATPGDVSYISSQGSTGSCNLAIYQGTGRWFIIKAGGTGAGSRLNVGGAIETDNQLKSTVATGTAPLAVTSTTEVTNLNANQLQGYTANNLPYLRALVNTWNNSSEGQPRFYFANNSSTYFRTGADYYFRSDGNNGIGSLNDNGCWTFYSGNDTVQSTYGLQVNQLNGINLNASEGLSSGQKSTVLRATGDKQWIDTYGVMKRNRNTIAENISVNNGDNCMSAGPLEISNGTTITINNGGSWSVV